MPRPETVSNEDLERWGKTIDEDLSPTLASNLLIREVCYAGQWLGEQLKLLECSEDYIVRILYTAGQISFGRDPWEVSQQLLTAYKNNDLQDEAEDFNIN